jgi:hypothetical protein
MPASVNDQIAERLYVLAMRLRPKAVLRGTAVGVMPVVDPPKAQIRWGLLWSLVGMLILLLEGVAVGSKAPGDTLSESMRDVVRFDLVGRFVLVPAWSWLTWHWIMRPQSMLGISWRDFVAVGIGVAYAAWETFR